MAMDPKTRSVAAEILRFGATSLVMLALKIGLMQGFLRLMSELPAYAVVQVFLFFASYLLHSFWTFRRAPQWSSLGGFFRTISLFQVLDYVIFSVVFTRFHIDSTLVILIATMVVFLARFVFVRRALRGQTS